MNHYIGNLNSKNHLGINDLILPANGKIWMRQEKESALRFLPTTCQTKYNPDQMSQDPVYEILAAGTYLKEFFILTPHFMIVPF